MTNMDEILREMQKIADEVRAHMSVMDVSNQRDSMLSVELAVCQKLRFFPNHPLLVSQLEMTDRLVRLLESIPVLGDWAKGHADANFKDWAEKYNPADSDGAAFGAIAVEQQHAIECADLLIKNSPSRLDPLLQAALSEHQKMLNQLMSASVGTPGLLVSHPIQRSLESQNNKPSEPETYRIMVRKVNGRHYDPMETRHLDFISMESAMEFYNAPFSRAGIVDDHLVLRDPDGG